MEILQVHPVEALGPSGPLGTGPLDLLMAVLQDPLAALVHPDLDLKAHLAFSFIQPFGTVLDQSKADMNMSVIQLLTSQKAANAHLQLQSQQNQVVQMAHTDALRTLAEFTQQRSFDHIFASIFVFDGTKKGRLL